MATDVIDGELVERGIDADQAYKFEEFRTSSDGQDSSLMVNVYLHPSNADGTAVVNAKLQHLFSLPIDQLTREQILDKVRNEFMGVNDTMWMIRIHIRKPGERGLRFNDLQVVRKRVNAEQASEHYTPGGSDTTGVLGAVAKMLADAQARTDQMFTRLLESNKTPAIDPIKMYLDGQKQSAEMFKELAAAMRPAVGGPTASDAMTELVKTMTVMEQLRGYMDRSGGGAAAAAGASGDGLADIIKALTPLAAPVLQAIAAGRAKTATAQPALPNPNAPRADAAPTAPEAAPVEVMPGGLVKTQSMMEDETLFNLKEQLGQLADLAEAKPDPEQVAGVVLENTPESADAMLLAVLKGDNWFERLAVVQPKLRPHQEWMTQVRNAIIASFDNPDEIEAPEALQ